MNNKVQLFKDDEFGIITTVEKNGEPWFVAKDIAEILGYATTEKMTRRLDDDEKTNAPFQGSGSNYQTNKTIINEPGFYTAIIGSQMPNAKKFKRWVTHKVLPAIRKTGFYSATNNKKPSIENIYKAYTAGIKMAKQSGMSGNNAILTGDSIVQQELGVSPLEMCGIDNIAWNDVKEISPGVPSLKDFLEDCCTVFIGSKIVRVSPKDLYSRYQHWCYEKGNKPYKKKYFNISARLSFGDTVKTNGHRTYRGVNIKN